MMTENRDLKATALSVVIQAGGKSIRMGENKALMFCQENRWSREFLNALNPLPRSYLSLPMTSPVLSFWERRWLTIWFRIWAQLVDFIPLWTLATTTMSQWLRVIAICKYRHFAKRPWIIGAKRCRCRYSNDRSIFYEPLHAVYRRGPCKEAIYQSIVLDQRRLVSWLPRVKVIELRPDLYRSLTRVA